MLDVLYYAAIGDGELTPETVIEGVAFTSAQAAEDYAHFWALREKKTHFAVNKVMRKAAKRTLAIDSKALPTSVLAEAIGEYRMSQFLRSDGYLLKTMYDGNVQEFAAANSAVLESQRDEAANKAKSTMFNSVDSWMTYEGFHTLMQTNGIEYISAGTNDHVRVYLFDHSPQNVISSIYKWHSSGYKKELGLDIDFASLNGALASIRESVGSCCGTTSDCREDARSGVTLLAGFLTRLEAEVNGDAKNETTA